ncbi:MAG TPA: acetyl-CoA carboxylase biotin carboxylase subunit [Cytophagales bacterium]|nr:acetyl-CoA carboxylase biotin carboxylase subunit [Cytophagales bacterium]
MGKIKKLLVANRGEIALRIMRTAREMNIATVAVFSEADRKSPHVRFADEAICIGPPPSSQSYLDADKIIAVCKQVRADAIHPGYGFLSENAAFARKVKEAGLIFIGPPEEAIDVMGSKLAAKNIAAEQNVPLVPGTQSAITDIEEAKQKADEIGYPILIKASAGGGGKGMRIVDNESEFEEQMARATSEAQSAFGDGSVFIEKYILSPRHIEIQILGDQQGNVVYLFERECSIQRRHQKVIEEAPSSILTPEVRKAMGECAVTLAKACGYYNAGTVEFIVDENLKFYFLEMNTRLQVEHPVTEQITGLDLVRLQIEIAEGKPLSVRQEDLKILGHSMEVRVYAEDPKNNFLPDIGKLMTYQKPQGPGVRVDDGFEEGMEVPIYYDPMLAKLITTASTRNEAIDRMIRAIEEFRIIGVETTLPFCKYVMEHPNFKDGNFDTNFIKNHFTPEQLGGKFNEAEAKIAAWLAVKIFMGKEKTTANNTTSSSNKSSKWKNRLHQ